MESRKTEILGSYERPCPEACLSLLTVWTGGLNIAAGLLGFDYIIIEKVPVR